MDFNLSLKQELKLILTQEMQLSLNILELSPDELVNFLEKEKKENPGLEIIYPTKSYKPETDNSDNYNYYNNDTELLTTKLEEQIGYLNLLPSIKSTSIFIVNNLTDKGYLGMPKSEIQNYLKIPTQILNESLAVVQSLEPLGVGAENLQDCLKIQLKSIGKENKIIFEIIDFHLKNLANGDFNKVAKALNIDVDEVKNHFKLIQSLNPIPARGYNTKSTSTYVTPDVEIEIIDDTLTYKINDEYLPKVYINTDIQISPASKERISYIIKSIEKRYETLGRIVEFLIDNQREFFFKGKKYLRTLYLKDIAESLDLHMSTVSRAMKNKFLHTPQGVITFKNLLLHDENIFKIKDIIENSIENENPNFPISDNGISQILLREGYVVARRTVAKYREELGIPSTRKRGKKL